MGFFHLTPTVKNYAWGKKGNDSLVAKLLGLEIESDLPYAELWMGAHPSSPSIAKIGEELISLDQLISSDPKKYLGVEVSEKFSRKLPFLFKVLSIDAPLSIQLHPDLALAKELHAKDPENYPDENHKPEVAVALGDLELLYGFRPLDALFQLSKSRKTLAKVIKDKTYTSVEAVYKEVMSLDPSKAKELCKELYHELNSSSSPSSEDLWALKLREIYPDGDIGVFSLYLLNLVKLPDGEAVYSLPFVPHAYLSGELVECMANSDNTIRAGLTNKFCDVETLINYANYQITEVKYANKLSEDAWTIYKTPAREFELGMSVDNSFQTLVSAPSILVSLKGETTLHSESDKLELKEGEVAFLTPSKTPIQIEQTGVLFRASVPS